MVNKYICKNELTKKFRQVVVALIERKIKRPQAVCLCVLCVLLDQLAVMVVQPLHLLYMSQGVDFCWGAYIFC